MSNIVHVSCCSSGVFHLSIGAITLRLDREIFQHVVDELAKHSQKSGESAGHSPSQNLRIVRNNLSN